KPAARIRFAFILPSLAIPSAAKKYTTANLEAKQSRISARLPDLPFTRPSLAFSIPSPARKCTGPCRYRQTYMRFWTAFVAELCRSPGRTLRSTRIGRQTKRYLPSRAAQTDHAVRRDKIMEIKWTDTDAETGQRRFLCAE